MEHNLILETSFLIDFERERQGTPGPAMEFLKRHPHRRLHITHTVAGELAAGKSLGERRVWEAFIHPFKILPWTVEVDWEFGKTFHYLQAQGLLIGSNDLWIAATALAHGMPVLTENVRHYRRVPGLSVETYVPA